MNWMSFILTVIIVMAIGIVAEKLTPFTMPGRLAGSLLAGFIGSWIGPYLFGIWGPMVIGISLVPSLLGAIIFVMVVGFIAEFFG